MCFLMRRRFGFSNDPSFFVPNHVEDKDSYYAIVFMEDVANDQDHNVDKVVCVAENGQNP